MSEKKSEDIIMAVRINSVVAAVPDYLLEIHFSYMCFSVVVGLFCLAGLFLFFWLVAWFWFFLPP